MEIQTQALRILVVDDDPSAIEILAFRLQELRLPHELTVFEDGQKALTYLHEQAFRNPGLRSELPDLIILDLYLPGAKGLEVLKVLKADHALRGIPVLVMTASERPTDILNTYKSGGTAFLSKLEGAEALGKAIKQMRIFGLLKNIQG